MHPRLAQQLSKIKTIIKGNATYFPTKAKHISKIVSIIGRLYKINLFNTLTDNHLFKVFLLL